MTRPMRSRRSRLLGLLIFGTAAAGCIRTTGQTSPDAVVGYIVAGPQAATAFHVSPSRRIPELPIVQVSQVVRNAAEREAVLRSQAPECNRYFGDSALVLVLFVPPCGPDTVQVRFDSRWLAAFDAEGRSLGTIDWYVNDAATVVPFMRLKRH